ncbi:hypothetical protein [Streptomyces sp. DT195]|uniref:hypothetical protein n=1 Tax=Streptomyces sp. DT195 TaxID=3393419 RepID=UPI003CECADB1
MISSNSSAEVSEEYAEQVEQLLGGSWKAVRETTKGHDFYIRLHTYEAPGTSETMWAVDYSDPVSRELEETSDEAEANARYEECVRDSAASLGIDSNGRDERFTTTDVDGIPAPLPDLPNAEEDQVADLIDQPGTPVLYLALDEDGDPVVRIGQADDVETPLVLLTREEVLDYMHVRDGETRVTTEWAAAEADGYGNTITWGAHIAEERMPAAADIHFPVPVL